MHGYMTDLKELINLCNIYAKLCTLVIIKLRY